MTVDHIMSIIETKDGLKVIVGLKCLPNSEDTAETLACVQEEAPQLLILLLSRKYNPLQLAATVFTELYL